MRGWGLALGRRLDVPDGFTILVRLTRLASRTSRHRSAGSRPPARPRLQNLSKNRVESRRRQWTPVDRHYAKNPWDLRTLATKRRAASPTYECQLARVRIPAPEPIQRAIGGQSFSTTSRSPRAALAHALAASVATALDVGDTRAARIAIDALNALVDATPSNIAVVHLEDGRVKRGPTR